MLSVAIPTRVLVAVLGLLALAAAAPSSQRLDRFWWKSLAASKPIPATQSGVDLSKGTPVLLKQYGYDCETHTVQTVDGYLLTVHRIPNAGKPPVFLQHGILSSSADWVVMGKNKALGLILHDAGYDVWMGNNRGNKFSRGHIKYGVKNSKFWDFSWHEIGMYDLPAMIDYVLTKTDTKKLTYVGHSQGTTAFFVMGSMRPEYNDKISGMFALAPIAYMNNIKSPALKLIAMATSEIAFMANVIGANEFLPSSKFLSYFETAICKKGAVFQPICKNALFIITGYDDEEIDVNMVPVITANVPAGSSTKQMVHYGQLINAGKPTFRQYDHGMFSNWLKYGQTSPPEYPVEKITAPVYLHYSENDSLGVPECAEHLSKKIPNVQQLRKVPFEKFNHIDFLYAKDSLKLLYNDILESMNKIHQSVAEDKTDKTN